MSTLGLALEEVSDDCSLRSEEPVQESDRDAQSNLDLGLQFQGKDNQGDTNQLCIDDDLQEVYSQLFPAAKDWFDMGLALGIKVDILEGIDSNKDTDKARLRGMLTHWLRSSKSPTWSDICNVLRSNTVQQDNLAYTIEGTYQGLKKKLGPSST